MKYKIKQIINFDKYEDKYRAAFEKLCKIVDRSYAGKDLSRRKPRNPVEGRILKELYKQPA